MSSFGEIIAAVIGGLTGFFLGWGILGGGSLGGYF
jgi:hypothetical protein